MCCFSRPIKHVSQTQLFARSAPSGGQFLVYKMSVEIDADLAMILPLPVPPGCAEDALRFIDLSGYDDFFTDLARGFPEMVSRSKSRGPLAAAAQSRPKLEVHAVGDFDASFVPSPRDFDRLDEKFRLPSSVWDKLPEYADYGFAVFKLRQKQGFFARLRGSSQSFHPMALEFPRRDKKALFFPTVHVHDGKIHRDAEFDHTLYCQPDPDWAELCEWEESEAPLGRFANPGRAAGILDGAATCRRSMMLGSGRNRDTILHADEMRARIVDHALFGLRFRLYYGDEATELGFVPEHPSWARDMPDACRRAAAGFAAELDRLLPGKQEKWSLIPYTRSLPQRHPSFYASFPELLTKEVAESPCRVEFALTEQVIASRCLWVCLAFSKLPSQKVCESIAALLKKTFAPLQSAVGS
jgi:hypothetical protein